MKKKISISVDEKVIEKVKCLVETGKFRSKSHVFDFALREMIGGEND